MEISTNRRNTTAPLQLNHDYSLFSSVSYYINELAINWEITYQFVTLVDL